MKLAITDELAIPVYFAQATDPLYTIEPTTSGPTVTIHIPSGATPQSGTAPKMTVIDVSTNQGVGLSDAYLSDGQWVAAGADRYFLDSNGLAERVGGPPGNTGHRGATSVNRTGRLDEVSAGVIPHRLHCMIPPQLIDSEYVWPMTGSDGTNTDGIPEGVLLRIRPAVDLPARGLTGAALVIARNLQSYGCIIADGGSSRAATVRLERADWASVGINKDSLSTLSWKDWKFVRAGYRP